MPNQRVTAEMKLVWDMHETWTEAYIGIRHLVYDVLPKPGRQMPSEFHALCQLALVGSNHLMEVGLYKFLQSRPSYALLPESKKKQLRAATYNDMLTIWIQELADWKPDLKSPPLKCTERLRRRRNDTVHKTSAAANVPMARSALYSAVAGSQQLWLKSKEAFPYQSFLLSYPLQDERPFSEVTFP
ncbi:MAG: hypothetical protein KA739_13085 [Pseudomonadales bacterium]|jgi:hypothetical protein|nr:hypothetical protein [Gammaproteobacteria bacterium]MBP6052773.1 hypothetical protein [Pseudomonadales bacterium]MBK6584909.1 hypothetical protein [Gammaproteobacteria bacterium]MBK7519587.1 hypothetical protein [Gammaproteobacteria bacterium]MBK8307069.1 hypothetical protein [Gammaproteobacteria bacterium]